MNTIDKIRAEIERRREANKRQYLSSAEGMSWQRMCGEEDCLVELLAFLDTLEELDKDLDDAAENIYKVPFGTRAEDFKAGAEWAREQKEWKPTEEQMKALKEVAYNIVGTGTATDIYLVQLYEQLKAIKEDKK